MRKNSMHTKNIWIHIEWSLWEGKRVIRAVTACVYSDSVKEDNILSP